MARLVPRLAAVGKRGAARAAFCRKGGRRKGVRQPMATICRPALAEGISEFYLS
jgi:hypothetical protein